VRPGHLGWSMTKPTFVVPALSDPFEVNCRPPVSGADLSCRTRQHIPGPVQTQLLGWVWRDPLHPMVVGFLTPGFLGIPELLGDPNFKCAREVVADHATMGPSRGMIPQTLRTTHRWRRWIS